MADYYINPTSGTPNSGTYRGLFTVNTAYAVGDRVVPQRAYATAAAKGYIYECTTAGTSAGTEPTWVFTTPNTSTTTSNTAVFTCRNCTTWANATVYSDYIVSNKIAAGDTVYRLSGVDETVPAVVGLAFPNTLSNPCRYIAVSDTAEPPTTVSTCNLYTTGSSAITISGSVYMHGVNFYAGSATSPANITMCNTSFSQYHSFKNCSFNLNNTASTSVINLTSSGGQSSYIYFDNVNISFGHVSQKMYVHFGNLYWKGGAITGSIAPTNLFDGGATSRPGQMEINGVDLSLMTTGKSLFALGVLPGFDYKISNSKLGSGASITSGALTVRAVSIELNNVSAIDSNYTFSYSRYEGTLREETAIVKTNGASDGTTPYTFKIVTSANAKVIAPLVTPTLPVIWNETIGSSVTVTVDLLHDSVTALHNDEVWMVVEYLGTSGFSKSNFISSGLANILATSSTIPASSATWPGNGMTNPNTQKMSVTFTPEEVGYIQVKVYVGIASYTLYVDPKLQVS